MNRPPRAIAVLELPRSHGALLERARVIVLAIAAHPAEFPQPSPSLAEVGAAIDAFEAAELATRTRTVGTVAARDAKREALVLLLRRVRHYVQGRVDLTAPAQRPALAEGAAMRLKRVGVHRRVPLVVKTGEQAGAVQLVASGRRGRRVANEWQYSLDQKSWQALPASLQARTRVANLPPGALTWFRHRVVTKDGPSEWSQLVSAIVQ